MDEEQQPLQKKTILLTGGNSGIGLEACKILCREGHKVIATVRSKEKGEHCVSYVRDGNLSADVEYLVCDMTDLASVRNMVKNVEATWLHHGNFLDVLINNAGMSPPDVNHRTMCENNPEWEVAMATNCLGPVLLTELLKDHLIETAKQKGESRIVMVNSGIITFESFGMGYQTDMNDLMLENPKNYKNAGQAYKNSKVALMMATMALNDELRGTNVKITSICPGHAPDTNISRHMSSSSKCCMTCLSFLCCCCLGTTSLDEGGDYITEAAVRERGTTGNGQFFVKNNLTPLPPQCMDISKQTAMLRYIRELVHVNSDQSDNI